MQYNRRRRSGGEYSVIHGVIVNQLIQKPDAILQILRQNDILFQQETNSLTLNYPDLYNLFRAV
jgi:hypothetical protein